jgi:hypothetical protein
MDTNLRGITLPSPRFRIAPFPKELANVRGFTSLQTFFPTLSKLFRLTKHTTDNIWLDSKWRITGIDISGTSGPCSLNLMKNIDTSGSIIEEKKVHPAYLKVTHLLDPVRWMKGRYSLPKEPGLPWHNKTWTNAWTKLQDSWNQAYVEAIAAYALGRLCEEGLSPHFNEFYGAFCATADIYRYNLSEEFDSFRNSRWFWNGKKNGMFELYVQGSEEPIDNDKLNEILREPSIVESLTDSEESHASEAIDITDNVEVEVGEMNSLHSDEMSSVSFAEESEHSNDESISEDPFKIYAEMKDFPVMLIAIQNNKGTMDSLLDDIEEVGATPGTSEWELRWSAWLFQIVAALSVAQAVIGFTHNDLHTNNVVWTPTTEEFMYYTLRSGAVFKVPTFGKLFRIIDFGRAIFTINGTQFISDDFRPGNDAEGQYSFKPLVPRPAEDIPPNPSFDLSRLAVSLFNALFPDAPEDKEGGEVISTEEGLEVNETVSPLFNCLWAWMMDDNGCNILIEPSGEERYPDFYLYKHIAQYVHNAVPSQQFKQPVFDQFQVNPSEIGEGVKKWQLFA